jgi:hypothetical protein
MRMARMTQMALSIRSSTSCAGYSDFTTPPFAARFWPTRLEPEPNRAPPGQWVRMMVVVVHLLRWLDTKHFRSSASTSPPETGQTHTPDSCRLRNLADAGKKPRTLFSFLLERPLVGSVAPVPVAARGREKRAGRSRPARPGIPVAPRPALPCVARKPAARESHPAKVSAAHSTASGTA